MLLSILAISLTDSLKINSKAIFPNMEKFWESRLPDLEKLHGLKATLLFNLSTLKLLK